MLCGTVLGSRVRVCIEIGGYDKDKQAEISVDVDRAVKEESRIPKYMMRV